MFHDRPHRAPHQVVRYAPVLRRARRLGDRARILDVGSGSEGIGTWLRRPFVGVDPAFTRVPLPWMRAVAADGSRLPFPNGVFALALSADVLPEIPRASIAEMCAEMARVARTVVIVTPCGPDAERSDARMAAWHRGKGLALPDWLELQERELLPRVEHIRDALGAHGRVSVEPNTSVAWHERLLRFEHGLRRAKAMTAVQPPLLAWGRTRPFELAGSGPVYRWTFTLESGATSSPPARLS